MNSYIYNSIVCTQRNRLKVSIELNGKLLCLQFIFYYEVNDIPFDIVYQTVSASFYNIYVLYNICVYIPLNSRGRENIFLRAQ